MFGNFVVESAQAGAGTGAFALNGSAANTPYISMITSRGNGSKWVYLAESTITKRWAIYTGVVTAGSPNTLSRVTVLESWDGVTRGTAEINWTSNDGVLRIIGIIAAQVIDGVISWHRGASAPAWAVPGTLWIDDSAEPVLVFKQMKADGATWATLFTFDESTGLHLLAGNATEALGAVPKQQAESIAAAAVAAITPRIQTFAATGTYTPHAKMVYCIIECIGGGGGGGGTATGAAGIGTGGGGGGAGSYARKVATAADIGASKAVTIGAAGAAGSSGNNAGGNGGDTSVGTLCIGKGGTGGGGSDGNIAGTSGAGGVAGTGDVTQAAAPGGQAQTVAGSNGRGISGYGANASQPGGGGAPGTNTATTQAGTAAAGKGGGGSGGSTFNAGGAAAGGAGGAGYVVITEFCWA